MVWTPAELVKVEGSPAPVGVAVAGGGLVDDGGGVLPELGGTPPLFTGTTGEVGAVGLVGVVGATGAAAAGADSMFQRKYPPTPTAPSTSIVEVAFCAIRGPPERYLSGRRNLA